MKKIFIPYIIGVLVMLDSCQSRLDVSPTQTIDQSIALNTSKDVEAALVGAYDGLQGTNSNGDTYAGGYQYTSELLAAVSNEVRFGGTFANLQELFRKEITTINITAEGLWMRSYLTINRTNNVLANVEKVGAKNSVLEGEALFIRGAVYFELVRLYAKQWGDGNNTTNLGVPLVFTPTTIVTEANKIPRSTVAQVYAQAIEDLTKAEQLLPVTNRGAYATKGAAAAILARIYLQQGNYAAARDAANRVIASNRYRLVTPFGMAFNTKLNNNGGIPAEYVFSIQVNDQDGFNGMNTFFGATIGSIPGTAGRGDIRIQPDHIALYEAGDARGAFFIKPTANTFTYKFLDRFGHVPVVRLAEMILTRAEANFRLGTAVGATPVEDINSIRNRAGLPSVTSVTLASILKERKLELAFEGHALHDIKRTGGTVGALPFNSPKLILPIPQREMDVNKQLVQNEGY